jgi:hypothetical protein
MSMRHLMNLCEAARTKKPEMIEEALWWVSRWVTGSMDDPDWDWAEGEALGVDRAFQIIQDTIGNTKSVGKPLYRYIAVSEAQARSIIRTKKLHPHEHGFQSFTTSFEKAVEAGEWLDRSGDVHLVVQADVDPQDVMFGLADLKANKLSARTVLEIADWHHQDEVVVRMMKPLVITGAKRVKLDGYGG